MGRRVDVDDLIDAAEVAEMVGWAWPNNVYSRRKRDPDFPQPVITHGRCYMWHRSDIRRWMRTRERKR